VPSKSARVVVLHSAEVQHLPQGERLRAHVRLERPSRGFFLGVAELGERVGSPGPVPDLRCSAQAALDALKKAVAATSPATFELHDVETFEAFGSQAVMVRLSVTIEHQTRTLMGFCPVGGDPPKAAARAVLDATNRLLGIG